jgi:hypothetical protein
MNLCVKLKETDINISSKLFDQALEKTSSMLLGNLHLHTPYKTLQVESEEYKN